MIFDLLQARAVTCLVSSFGSSEKRVSFASCSLSPVSSSNMHSCFGISYLFQFLIYFTAWEETHISIPPLPTLHLKVPRRSSQKELGIDSQSSSLH